MPPRPPRFVSVNGILGWIPEIVKLSQNRFRSQIRLLGLAALVGVVAGLGAIVFYVATRVAEHYALGVIAGYYPEPRPGGEATLSWLPVSVHPFFPWLLLLVPAVGGLISGVIVFTFAPEAEGHGTDSVIAAYHNKQGQIRPRVPLVKIIASSITLGTGGSGGREGPIAQIGAGFGSLLANMLRLRPVERRVLMAAGMGAGIGAIFRAPLAGTIFAGEVLYSSTEFEPEVIIPAGIASVISYCVYGMFSGWEPLFTIPADLTFTNPLAIGTVPDLGPVHGPAGSTLHPHLLSLPRLVSSVARQQAFPTGHRCLFHRTDCLRPVFPPGQNKQVLAVLAFGYSAIQNAMTQDATATAGILLTIALGKILTTSLTIGSGGSGGVFGPSMVIGGCGGGALGIVLHHWWPWLVPHPASFVIVGMAGFFAAAAKTPFSTLIIVSEMTGGYHLLLPSLWVCTLSFILSDKQSIYSSQVESRSLSPAHQGSYVRQVLAQVCVNQFFKPIDGATLSPQDSLDKVLDRLSMASCSVLPVVDSENRLLGVVTLDEVHLASQSPSLKALVLVEDLMRSDVQPLTPEVTLDRALELFVENDLLSLPVVGNLEERRVLGMVSRFEISSAYLRHVHGPAQAKEQ